MTTFNVSTTSAFQSALGQAKAGDSILLAAGTYSGISIQNVAEAGTVTIASQNAAKPAVLEQFSITNSSGLAFSHLDLSAVGTTDPNYVWRISGSSNISFDSMAVTGEPSLAPDANPCAFYFNNCTNISVTNSTFQNLLDGVLETNNQHVNISNNLFTQMGGDGIDNSAVAYVTIDNNSFTDFETGAQHPDAIQFWTQGTTVASHDITISGNTYTRGDIPASSDAQGIFMADEVGTLPYQNVTITNNTILGSMYNGIYLEDGQNSTISNNTVLGYSDMESWIRVVTSTTTALSNNVSQDYILSGNTGSVTQTSDRTANATSSTPPALSNTGAAQTYHAGGAAAAVAGQLSLTDVGSPIVMSATATITGGHLASDALNFTNQNGISGSYNASTGVLTLSGMATVASYQSALDSVTFSSSASDPTNGGADASRTVSFVVNDPTQTSVALTASVSVTSPVSPPPPPPPPPPPSVANSGAAATYTVGGAAADVAHSLTITDAGSTTLASASVAISGGFLAGDALGFVNQNGITGSYNAATGVLSLSGTASVAAYQTALDSVTFSSNAANPVQTGAARTVSVSVNDGSQSSASLAASVTLTPKPVTELGGGATVAVSSSAFILNPNSVAPPQTTGIGTHAAGRWAADHLDLAWLRPLSHSVAVVASIADISAGDRVIHHLSDFVLPMGVAHGGANLHLFV